MSYNGWKNYETWNVALWINNDQGLRSLANDCSSYDDFCEVMREGGSLETPDRVAWSDSGLDHEALDEVILDKS